MKKMLAFSTLLFVMVILAIGSVNKKANVYIATFPNTISSMQNQKLKLFLQQLQSQGLEIGEVKSIDTKEVIQALKHGEHWMNQVQSNALTINAKASYIVEINGEYVELYDCSNYAIDQTQDLAQSIKQNNIVRMGDVDAQNLKRTSKEKYIKYKQFFKDNILMMYTNNKSETQIKQIFS